MLVLGLAAVCDLLLVQVLVQVHRHSRHQVRASPHLQHAITLTWSACHACVTHHMSMSTYICVAIDNWYLNGSVHVQSSKCMHFVTTLAYGFSACSMTSGGRAVLVPGVTMLDSVMLDMPSGT